MKYISLAFLLLTVGCGVKAPIEGRHDPYVPSQIQFTDEELRTDTAIGSPVTSLDAGGLRRLTAHPVLDSPPPAPILTPPAKNEPAGRVPKWPKGTGCKPVGVSLRRFESYRAHFPLNRS